MGDVVAIKTADLPAWAIEGEKRLGFSVYADAAWLVKFVDYVEAKRYPSKERTVYGAKVEG